MEMGQDMQKNNGETLLLIIINSKQNGEYKILECSHYVHNIEYQKIYDEKYKIYKQFTITN